MTTTNPEATCYPASFNLMEKVRKSSPTFVTRKELWKAKREWQGKRVAVMFIRQRGNAHQYNDERFVFGTFTTVDRDDQIAVMLPSGDVFRIHYRRVVLVYLQEKP
jgi:hypothetical protein